MTLYPEPFRILGITSEINNFLFFLFPLEPFCPLRQVCWHCCQVFYQKHFFRFYLHRFSL